MIHEENLFLPNRWQMYIGVMTESTAFKNQRWFHIFVPEFLPDVTGDVTGGSTPASAEMPNIWGATTKPSPTGFGNQIEPTTDGGQVKVTQTIYADYMGFDPAMDVPTVYRNMQVMVINYANSDKWYWIPLERDRSYKTFEHVRLSALDQAITNKTPGVRRDNVSLRNRAITDDNTYFIELDTKYHKRILLGTANSDGEPWRYFIELSPETNTLEICDVCSDGSQPNNTIKIESRPSENIKGRITLQNASGTTFLLDGENMAINVPRNLTFSVGGDYIVNIGGNYSQVTGMAKTELVVGTKTTTVTGAAANIYKDNLVEAVGLNKDSTVVGQFTEKQANRMTVCEMSTWVSTKAFNLTTNALNMEVSNFMAKMKLFTLDVVTLNLTAQICNTTFGKHVLAVLAAMSYVLPFHVSVPETPVQTHTTYK